MNIGCGCEICLKYASILGDEIKIKRDKDGRVVRSGSPKDRLVTSFALARADLRKTLMTQNREHLTEFLGED